MKIHNDIIEKLKNAIYSYTNSESLYWYPLRELTCGFSAVAYDVNALYEDDRVDDLSAIIKYCNIRFVTMVQMDYETVFHNEDIRKLLYARDEEGFDFPGYVETYYFDQSKSWLIYVSHEETISFTGKDLAECAGKILPGKYRI